MRKPLIAALILALSTGAVYADDSRHPDKKEAPAKTAPKQKSNAAPAAKSSAASVMDNMQKMQKEMDAIMQMQDPQKRQAILEEHMRTMKETMNMMRNMNGGKGISSMDCMNSGKMQQSMNGGEMVHTDMMQPMMKDE